MLGHYGLLFNLYHKSEEIMGSTHDPAPILYQHALQHIEDNVDLLCILFKEDNIDYIIGNALGGP